MTQMSKLFPREETQSPIEEKQNNKNMKIIIEYEIKTPSPMSLIWKTFYNKKLYYKIKNNTSKTLTLYCVMESVLKKQDYKKLGKKLKKINNIKKVATKATFDQKIKKIVLDPHSKNKIHFKKLLPIYWIDEEYDLLYNISGFRTFDKIVFDEYEEDELKTESKLIYEKEMKNNSELIEEV